MILRFIITLVVLYLLYRVVKGILPALTKKEELSQRKPEAMEDLVEDPCCRTYVPKSSAYAADIDGEKTYFCSRDCYLKYINKE